LYRGVQRAPAAAASRRGADWQRNDPKDPHDTSRLFWSVDLWDGANAPMGTLWSRG
jgi:hypothetical protein